MDQCVFREASMSQRREVTAPTASLDGLHVLCHTISLHDKRGGKQSLLATLTRKDNNPELVDSRRHRSMWDLQTDDESHKALG